MNRRIINLYTISLVTLLTLQSCTREIDVNINNITPRIVIQGDVTDAEGPYTIRINRTVNLNDPSTPPAVSGASVIIQDATASITDTLQESSAGVYRTSTISGHPGHTYQLRVTVDGQQYTSSSTMPNPVALDSISYNTRNVVNTGQVINAIANFQDPAGQVNYYKFEQFNRTTTARSFFVFSDQISDGLYLRYQLRSTNPSALRIGDSIIVTLDTVDRNVYEYFRMLDEQTNSTGLITISPGNLQSNISNGALGYFSAQTVRSRNSVVR